MKILRNIFSSHTLREYAMVFIINLSALATGMSLTWTSPMLVKLKDPAQTPLPRPITTEEGSWIVSLGFLICVFSNIATGYVLDLIGRKATLILVMVPKLCGCLLILFGKEVWMLILARGVLIVCDSVVFISVPIYASELASKEQRGALGTFLQVFCSIGIVTTLAIGPFVSYITYNIILPSVIIVAGLPLFFLPDSPYHQYSKGKTTEAKKTLTFLRGTETAAKSEIEEYEKAKSETKIDKIELFRNKLFLKSFGISTLLSSGAQLVGYNAVTFYMQTILESTNTSVRSEIGSVIVGLIQLAASICTVTTTDRFGRRPILIASMTGVLVGMLGLGTFFQVSQTPGYKVNGFMNYLPTTSLVIIVFCFSAGIGSISWLLTAELFEGPSRAYGVSTAQSLTMVVIFTLTKYFAALTVGIGAAATYWMFSVNCAVILALIFLFVPETKGKSFGEIQRALMERTFFVREERIEKQSAPI